VSLVAWSVELGHEFPVGGAGGGEFAVGFFELELQVENLLFQTRCFCGSGCRCRQVRRARSRARPARRASRRGVFRAAGNHYHALRREVLVVMAVDRWSLHWDEGADTPVRRHEFTGPGAVFVTVPSGMSHAIRNDGAVSMQIIGLSDGPYDATRPDAYPRTVVSVRPYRSIRVGLLRQRGLHSRREGAAVRPARVA
jgi:hypothetical protein